MYKYKFCTKIEKFKFDRRVGFTTKEFFSHAK